MIPLNDLAAQLALYDIVVCCTASPLPIIGKGLMESALKVRKHRPMLMFDLAVPRDIEAEVDELDDAFLYTVDDLGQDRPRRHGPAPRGGAGRSHHRNQGRISCTGSTTANWCRPSARCATPRNATPPRARAGAAPLARGADPQQVLDELSQALTNKFMHPPSHALNHAAGRA